MLTVVAVVAALVLAGVPPLAIGVGALAVWSPVGFLLAVAGWVVWSRRSRNRVKADDEAAFLGSMAAALAAGETVRGAIAAVGRRPGPVDGRRAARLAAAGAGPHQVSQALAEALPVNGPLVASTLATATETGGAVRSVVAELAERAATVGRLQRERRALTAQARLSAALVAGAPPAVLGLFVATGRVTFDSAAAGMIAVGLGLQAAGIAVVVSMLRKAER